MSNFTTRKTFLLPSLDLDVKEREKIDRFLKLLEKSNVESLFPKRKIDDSFNGGRPPYNYHNLLAVVLYGFAFSSPTLRDIETSCKYDLRYMYLAEQELYKHSVIGNFINDVIVPNRDKIFAYITKAIVEECNLDISEVFIDGTKFEADANKYKFVWKPTKFHERLSDKIRKLLKELNLNKNVPEVGIIKSNLIANKLTELDALVKSDESLSNSYNVLYQFLLKSLEYEEKERICGPNRNSYYKTDHDATAMALKTDYYSGLGSNMHAAYNTQIAVSKGIICAYYTSQSRTDINDFIETLVRFNNFFGYYPKIVCADSGYGSLENYRFLNNHNIENYVKYFTWEGNVSGSRPDTYKLNDDLTITCLNSYIGKQAEITNRHPRKAEAVFYKIEGCNNCNFKPYCKRYMKNKDEDFKIFEVVIDLIKYKQEAENNLLSPKGIELRINRSAQVEGAYGVIKQDMNYTRSRRISISKVETEHMLTYLGYNIRKLFRFYDDKAKFDYWKAPADLKPEEFKKPSFKKLNKKTKRKEAV